MNLFEILIGCDQDMQTILAIVQSGLNVVRFVIPAILIIVCTADIAKIVTSGKADENETKATTKKVTTRAIYALIIFLIPTIVKLLFNLITVPGSDVTIIDCMNGTGGSNNNSQVNNGGSVAGCYATQGQALDNCPNGKYLQSNNGQWCCY